MKLTGELKDKVDKTESMEEKKDIIAQAGMELTDDELDGVVGGYINDDLYDRIESCILRQADITRKEFLLNQLYFLKKEINREFDEDFLRKYFMKVGIDIG